MARQESNKEIPSIPPWLSSPKSSALNREGEHGPASTQPRVSASSLDEDLGWPSAGPTSSSERGQEESGLAQLLPCSTPPCWARAMLSPTKLNFLFCQESVPTTRDHFTDHEIQLAGITKKKIHLTASLEWGTVMLGPGGSSCSLTSSTPGQWLVRLNSQLDRRLADSDLQQSGAPGLSN